MRRFWRGAIMWWWGGRSGKRPIRARRRSGCRGRLRRCLGARVPPRLSSAGIIAKREAPNLPGVAVKEVVLRTSSTIAAEDSGRHSGARSQTRAPKIVLIGGYVLHRLYAHSLTARPFVRSRPFAPLPCRGAAVALGAF